MRLGSIIHGATEDVENAPVHVMANLPAQFGVKALGVAASEFRHLANSQPVEVRGYGWTYSRYAFKGPGSLSYLSDHMDSSFPLGSVK